MIETVPEIKQTNIYNHAIPPYEILRGLTDGLVRVFDNGLVVTGLSGI